MLDNRSRSQLLIVLYNIGLFGSFAACPLLAFLVSSIPDPNDSGRRLILAALVIAVGLVTLAIAARIAMRRFYARVCDEAFAHWLASPGLGATVDAELLAEMAGLRPEDAWNARQFLERKAAAAGIAYQDADTPNRRGYPFPRPK